jgi:hypothetical protein
MSQVLIQQYLNQLRDLRKVSGTHREVDTALPITVLMRPYFSSYHLWAARHFFVLSRNVENEEGRRPRFDIKHRAYVMNCIFSAVAFLEAAINELFQDIADGHESYVANLDADSKRLMSDFWQFTEQRNRSAFNLLDKYQIALTFLRKQQFASGHQPYQDAAVVVKLRNELVHYKPRSLGGDVEHTLAKQLTRKFQDNTLMSGSGNPSFPDKCLGYGCAEWSIHSATVFTDEFFGRIGVVPNYQRVQFQPSPNEA